VAGEGQCDGCSVVPGGSTYRCAVDAVGRFGDFGGDCG
jgi:hypothetical protein